MLDIRNQIVRLRWSIICSYVLAFTKLMLAFVSFSLFLGINALYTGAIGLGKHQGVLGMDADKEEKTYYHRVGSLILISSFIYLIYALHLFIDQETVKYCKNVAIVIAAVSFTEIGISIFGIFKANRTNNSMLQAVKLLNFSSSLISLVLTQSAILSFTSKSKNQATSNALLGLIFSVLTMGIGLWMITKKQSSIEAED